MYDENGPWFYQFLHSNDCTTGFGKSWYEINWLLESYTFVYICITLLGSYQFNESVI